MTNKAPEEKPPRADDNNYESVCSTEMSITYIDKTLYDQLKAENKILGDRISVLRRYLEDIKSVGNGYDSSCANEALCLDNKTRLSE